MNALRNLYAILSIFFAHRNPTASPNWPPRRAKYRLEPIAYANNWIFQRGVVSGFLSLHLTLVTSAAPAFSVINRNGSKL
jgi:hypothetical protein